MAKIQPVILAGGSGSRLWPLSRESYPKQLLRFTEGRSLLQNTLARLDNFDNTYPPIVVAGEEHGKALQNQLQELDLLSECTVLLEPYDKDTAAAIYGATEYIRRLHDEHTLIMMLPSDHLIEGGAEFADAIGLAADVAAEGYIVTLGVSPEWPETGYGYIEARDDGTIISFKEKPDVDLARDYIASGNYYWNSGILIFAERTFRKEMQQHAPEITEAMVEAVAQGFQEDNVFRFDPQSMARLEAISIDYALMEHTGRGAVVPLSAQWKDVGNWQAFWQIMEKDQHANVLKGDVIIDDTRSSLVISGDKLVATVGLEGIVVVETPDAVLVSSMEGVQKVSKVVDQLRLAGRRECQAEPTLHQPWGSSTPVMVDTNCRINLIKVKPHSKLPQEIHQQNSEYCVVVNGTAKITCDGEAELLTENQSRVIPARVAHQLENPGSIMLEIVEIQVGDGLEDD